MGDILAIISKAQFEAAHKNATVGEKLNFTKYVSSHAALEPVRSGGSIFLVTVRPPDERLWLLAELVNPKHDGKQWESKPSTLAVKDVTDLLGKLKFVNGKGISAKKGALGMSLQTPRQLTAEDAALLRGKPLSPSPLERGAGPTKPKKEEAAPPAVAKAPASISLSEVLDEWRATRAPELEELIITLGKHHARAFPQLDPEAPDYDAQWTARANVATPEDLDHLLPGLWSDPRGSIPMRLRKLLDLGADPRLGEALLKMADDPPLTASSNFSAWTILFKALPTMVDTRAKKRLLARAKKKGGDSQFWPKLTAWCTGAAEALEEPATLSKEQAASVAKRQKEASALLKGPPPAGGAAAPKKDKASAPVMKGSPREALEAALSAANAGKPLEVLEPLRQFWVVTREPKAAELMTAFARLGRAAQPDFGAGKAAEVHARWQKTAKTYDAALVTPLLEALLDGTLSDAEERLETMLASWPPDPRVCEAMCDRCIFGRDPYIGARPQLWKRAYDLTVAHADPRFVDKLTKNATRLENAAAFDRNRAERPHATRTLAPFTAAANSGRKPSADEAKLLSSLEAVATDAQKKKKAAAKPEQELALLLAINAAAPDDVAPYLVYADFLAERGDPRAELINLSIALERGEKVKGKLEAWLKSHERALVGHLKMRVHKPLEHLHRGFFKALSMDPWGKVGDAELEPWAEDLRWVTARTVNLPYEPKAHADFLLSRAPLYGLERITHASSHFLEVMSARDFDWALKVIELGGEDALSLSDKVKAGAFKKLEELRFTLWKPEVNAAFFDHPLVKACRRVSTGDLRSVSRIPVHLLAPLLAKLPKLETFEGLNRNLRTTFAATGDGRFDVALDVGAINAGRDDSFTDTLGYFKALDAKWVRSFKLGEMPAVAGYSQPNAESTELARKATRHLGG